MDQDALKIIVEKDGTVKVISDAVSQANHTTAEGILAVLSTLLGTPGVRTPREDVLDAHSWQHEHGEAHEHDTLDQSH